MKSISFNLLKTCILIFIVASISSCQDDNQNIMTVHKEKISGFAQKGPFNNGSSVLISELNADLTQTGKTITSIVENNQGLFEIGNIEFISQYVVLTVNGFYFNEVNGNNSLAQLTLYALSDISEKSSLNINVLSSIEKARVEYLISEGMTFGEAKNQAINEILEVFEIDPITDLESEALDISKSSDGNAALLAISAILQGNSSTADLSLLLANFSTDLKEDGSLDDMDIKSDLILNAKSLDLQTVRDNLEEYYDGLSLDYSIPDFESHVLNFIGNTDFEPKLIDYPDYGSYGLNILTFTSQIADTFFVGQDYSLAANLPTGGTVKIVMKNGLWAYETGSPENWDISEYDHENKTQTFTSSEPGINCDLSLQFIPVNMEGYDLIDIEYYEFGSKNPTKTKTICTRIE